MGKPRETHKTGNVHVKYERTLPLPFYCLTPFSIRQRPNLLRSYQFQDVHYFFEASNCSDDNRYQVCSMSHQLLRRQLKIVPNRIEGKIQRETPRSNKKNKKTTNQFALFDNVYVALCSYHNHPHTKSRWYQ